MGDLTPRSAIVNLSVPDQLCVFWRGVIHQDHRQILRGAFFSHAPDPQRDRESLGAVAYNARECSKTDPPLSSLLGDPGIPGAGDLWYGGSLSVEPYNGRSWEVLQWATGGPTWNEHGGGVVEPRRVLCKHGGVVMI